jgi:hypothetical protein
MKRRTAQSLEPEEELHAVEVHFDKCRPLQHLDRDLPGAQVSTR